MEDVLDDTHDHDSALFGMGFGVAMGLKLIKAYRKECKKRAKAAATLKALADAEWADMKRTGVRRASLYGTRKKGKPGTAPMREERRLTATEKDATVILATVVAKAKHRSVFMEEGGGAPRGHSKEFQHTGRHRIGEGGLDEEYTDSYTERHIDRHSDRHRSRSHHGQTHSGGHSHRDHKKDYSYGTHQHTHRHSHGHQHQRDSRRSNHETHRHRKENTSPISKRESRNPREPKQHVGNEEIMSARKLETSQSALMSGILVGYSESRATPVGPSVSKLMPSVHFEDDVHYSHFLHHKQGIAHSRDVVDRGTGTVRPQF